MANYLPVLLVSVSTNAIPDDSSVSTQPRAQVDYLSHDWQEEDVWRSWRNMTRQKNEIANGIRLENASWRTWWKQRNNLKTVTPETLNWLKDSDVTWLYGPLHTAVDWTPPPKPPSVPDSVALPNSASAHDRLDLSSHTPTRLKPPHKPILKHRSISELLTSDLPTSPIFSPAESEDEDGHSYSIYPSLDSITKERLNSSTASFSKRPSLQHTKSDTHITRWGPSRAFRKDSPPRIDPPGHSVDGYFPRVSAGGQVRTSVSQDSNSSASGSASGERTTQKKKHISFNTFVEQCIAIEKPKKNLSFLGSIGEGQLKEPRSGWEEDDGYEEDQEDSAEDEADVVETWDIHHPLSGSAIGSDSESPDEDEEDDDGIIEMRSSYRNAPKKKVPRSQSKVSNASTSSSASTASSTSNSTNSTNNSSSPSRDADSCVPSSASTTKRKSLMRRTSTSTYRPSTHRPPPLIRTPSEHVHVTIAPIAPTMLKTTEVWEEGFGDEGAGSDDGLAMGWRERMWGYAAGQIDHNTVKGKAKSRGRGRSNNDSQGSDGTPVELVYVPPFGSNYSFALGPDEEDDEEDEEHYGCDDGYEEEELEDDDYSSGILHTHRYKTNMGENPSATMADVYHHRGAAAGSVGFEDFSDGGVSHIRPASPTSVTTIPIPIPISESPSDTNDRGRIQYISPSSHSAKEGLGVPKVVVVEQGIANTNICEEDAYDFFGGPDIGEEYMEVNANKGRRVYTRSDIQTVREADERPSRPTSRAASSRSRSKSHSRTPSPAIAVTCTSSAAAKDTGPTAPSFVSNVALHSPTPTRGAAGDNVKRNCSSVSPSSSSAALLSPPTRGRSHQDLLQAASRSQSRGRSSTRTPPTSSWESSTSPIGSLSPDGTGLGSRVVGIVAYVGGGRLERERELDRGNERRGRDGGRERERGRDRMTDKRLSASVSVSPEPRTFASVGEAVPKLVLKTSQDVVSPKLAMDASICSTTSSSSSVSSTNTIRPAASEQGYQQRTEEECTRRIEEEHRRWTHPTPSNSPIIQMREPVIELIEDISSPAPPPPTPSSPRSVRSSSSAGSATPPSMNLPSSTLPDPPLSHSQSPNSNLTTPTKVRPPPLIPSPPHPAKPSTSYALSSPSPTSPKFASPSPLLTSASAIPSQQQHEGDSIIDKAAGIMNSAGAFLGLWHHSN